MNDRSELFTYLKKYNLSIFPSCDMIPADCLKVSYFWYISGLDFDIYSLDTKPEIDKSWAIKQLNDIWKSTLAAEYKIGLVAYLYSIWFIYET